MMNRLNFLLFGASGYTGRATIPAVLKLASKDGRKFTWGIAGRSRDKLLQTLNDVSTKLNVNLSGIPIIIADVNDEQSLNLMAAQTQVLINVCGPYRFFGEPVVKACIANGTHHLDISGEPQFIETMELKYKKAAELNKSYIISSCGFDSIPADLGVLHLENNFNGQLDAVEAHLETTLINNRKYKGPLFNYATWQAAVYGLQDYKTLKNVRQKLSEMRSKVPPKRKQGKDKGMIFKNSLNGKWSLPFPGADVSVVRRSQQYFYEHENKLPISYEMYFGLDSLKSVIGTLYAYASLSLLSKTEYFRDILLKHPKFFSFGVFSHGEPLEEDQANTKATILMKGTGISNDKQKKGTKDEIYGHISTINPSYGNTGTIVTLAAITLLEEKDKLPNAGNGGVFTPAAAFSKTSLIQKLNENGITFKIMSKL